MTLQPCSVCGRVQRFKRCLSCAVKAAWQDPDKRAAMLAGIHRRSDDPNWRSAEHFQRGADHPRFTGGKEARKLDMSRYEYKAWRTAVFKRDGYTCRECGRRGGHLIAHHIQHWADAPELRYSVENGITLCDHCHDQKHGWSRKPRTRYCEQCGARKKTLEGTLCRSCSNRVSYRDDLRVQLRICDHCGKDFKPRNNHSRFCSRACQGAASRVRITITCAYCGKTIERRPSDIQTETTYCSHACRVRAVKPRLKR